MPAAPPCRLARLAFLAATLLPACGGSSAVSPSSSAVSKSALGAGKCQSDGDEHKLFLVEWDATDLSSFESKAGRDLVFVKYEQCTMKVLHGCSDDGIAGRYGSYKPAEMTSGTLESLKVKTEDELYAKLPLGAATLGGEIARGKALDLAYHVSGTAYSTRDQVYKSDLDGNARCAGATHFVASYNLGAFRLSSVDSTKVGADVSVGSVGGGAKHADEASALKQGGDIASCATFDQHACRVPIRVLLRPVAAGARPGPELAAGGAPGSATATPAPAAGTPDVAGMQAQAMAMMQGAQLRGSAEQKLMAGDAQGCLTDLARSTGSRLPADPQTNMLRAKCEMRAGKCAEGKKHYREAKAAWTRQFDKTGLQTDATLDAEAEQMGRQFCPSAAAGGVSAESAALTLLQKVVQAQGAKDTAGCIRHGKELEKVVAAGADGDPMLKQAAGGLRAAAMCAADGGKCAEAKQLWASFSKGFFGKNADKDLIDSGFRENVKACAGK